ncbi:hypothetical protein [Maribacter sp. 2308TA10-17]|uniref:hypothetical protein n=1 Tax=Maribacter sp. 2308TA10-17 TaxID=3386276 RepID=UPI0039BC6F00
MKEFLNEYLIDNYLFVQLIPVLVGLFYYKKFKNSFYKYFIWLLVYVFLHEIVSLLYGTYVDVGNNQIIMNIFNVINFLFLFRLFYEFSEQSFFKKSILFFIVSYILALLYELIIVKIDYHTNAQVIPFMIGGLGILVCVLLYFYQTLNSEKVIRVHRDFMFWICTGYFIYYLAYVPFKIKQNYFAQLDEYQYLFKILIIATLIKGVLLIIGFIWSKRKQES